MGLQKKLEKWVAALEIDRGPAFWSRADAAPLKEFFSKLLAAEVVRSAPDLAVKDPIPFEKLLSIAQYKLGVHTCLVSSDLAGSEARLKLGLFGTTVFLKSALKDFDTADLVCLPLPDFGIAGGLYLHQPNCEKCKKDVLFVERVILAEKVWHRRCMHCSLCGRRLFLGTFRIDNGKLECFEHMLNKELVGNDLNANIAKPPPPRPPPPRMSLSSIPPAAAEAPPQLPSPSTTKRRPTHTPNNNVEPAESNWEVVEYPEQLNPFADDDDTADMLSDNISSLNPFGYSSDEESETESPPVPAPRKSFSQPSPVPEPQPAEPEQSEKEDCAEVKGKDASYDELRKLLVNPEAEQSFGFYFPASLVLIKKRLIELNDQDRPRLQHELDKVINTLDYIEKHSGTIERNLLKEISKEGFKWEKSALVDDWGRAMQQRHDNFIKGSMIVHELMKRLLSAALAKVSQLESSGVFKQDLKARLTDMKELLEDRNVALPKIMTEEGRLALAPVPAAKSKHKSLVKRIKKAF